MKTLFFTALALLVLFLNFSAQAACSAHSSSSSFGSKSSFELASSAQSIQTGSGFNCSGSLLALASTNTVTGTIAASANARGSQPQLYNAASGSSIPYTICRDTSCSATYRVGESINWSSTSLIGLLGLFNASDGSLPFYLRTATGVNVPAGIYTDTITVNWRYRICFAGILGVCLYDTGTASSTINVTLTVNNDCYINNAPDVDFGTAALSGAFPVITNALNIRCTRNAAYSVNLTGSWPMSGSWRRMASTVNGQRYYLQYQLYRQDGSMWGENNNLRVTGTGNAQTIPYRARINPVQPNQPAGRYSDTITVTVSY